MQIASNDCVSSFLSRSPREWNLTYGNPTMIFCKYVNKKKLFYSFPLLKLVKKIWRFSSLLSTVANDFTLNDDVKSSYDFYLIPFIKRTNVFFFQKWMVGVPSSRFPSLLTLNVVAQKICKQTCSINTEHYLTFLYGC